VCPQGLISVSGREMSAEQLAKRIMRCAAMFGDEADESRGGVTFSGGEPLLQGEFVLEVVSELERLCRETGRERIHCAIETSGYADSKTFEGVITAMDFVYMDLKLADEALHRQYTGVSNRLILQNLEILRRSGVPCVIRTPLIPGITDTKENLEAIRRLADDLPQELLDYNPMAGAKYPLLGMKFKYDEMARE